MKTRVLAGIDNLITVKNELKGYRVGLATGPSGVDANMRPTVDIIAENFKLTALFGAEHGIRGEAQAGALSGNFRDPTYNVPVYSLYDNVREPTASMLERVDAMLFDMQDVGARFYTYLTTLTAIMRACTKFNKPVYVFDRPNPIGLSRVEGNILDEKFKSFVGECAIPARYGLTIGEYAGYVNSTYNIGCDLTVVPCEGLTRDMYYVDTGLPFVPPSPNIPTPEAAVTYVGTCLFEGTNVSEGRGTTHPFEIIGAPWLKADILVERMKSYRFDGVLFRRAFFRPTFSKYAGEVCEGIQLHITDLKNYQPFEITLRLLDEIRANCIDFKWQNSTVDALFGDDKLRTEYTDRRKIDEFFSSNELKLEDFKEKTKKFHIYS